LTSQVWAGSRPSGEQLPPAEPRWLDAEEQKAWRAWLYSSLLLQDRLDRELTHQTGISHAYYEIPPAPSPGGKSAAGAAARSAPPTAAGSSPSSSTTASRPSRRPPRSTSRASK